MKKKDWQRAFGQPDEAFHQAFTEALAQLGEPNRKKRYRLSNLLVAAVLLTLAFAGAALATSGFGIFSRASVSPLEGAEALVETNLGATANELVRLTVEEAVRNDDEAIVLLRLTPLDPEHYALFCVGLETAPEGVYLFEDSVGEDGAEHRRVVGRTDGKTVIEYWPDLRLDGQSFTGMLDSEAQPDGSVQIYMTIQPGRALTDDATFTASAFLFMNDEKLSMDAVPFTLSRREAARTATYAPVDDGEVERVKVYGAQLTSTSVSSIARVSYALLPNEEDMGVSFHYLNGNGFVYELGEGWLDPLPDGDYEIPQGYEGERSNDRLQAMAEFPDELVLEVKVIGEDTILGRVTLKRVDE